MLTTLQPIERNIEPGDFNVSISGDSLLVPSKLYEILQRVGVDSPGEFISYVLNFPSAICALLDWNMNEVKVAGNQLAASLSGFLPDELLRISAPSTRQYGARPPESYVD
ncbi:MAG: hypothetical protein U0Y68_04770 [Blastocatellia bacterium]